MKERSLNKKIYLEWNVIKLFLNENALIFIFVFLYVAFFTFWESIIETYIIDKFLCYFEKNIVCDFVFILSSVCQYKLNELPSILWKSYENFELFLNGISDDEPSIVEYKKFVSKCKNSNFDKFSEFSFKALGVVDF